MLSSGLVNITTCITEATTFSRFSSSATITCISSAYTKAINKRYNRVGSLFQGRFKAIHIDRDEYLLHLSRYIHPVRKEAPTDSQSVGEFLTVWVGSEAPPKLSNGVHLNPIADRLVRRVEDWEFSNYPEFIGLRNGKLSKPGKVLSYFPLSDDYRVFVEVYVEDDRKIIEHLIFD